MSKGERGCTAPSLVASVLGMPHMQHSCNGPLLTGDTKILQYCWFEGRLDAFKFCLVPVTPKEGCPPYSAKTGGLHG